MQTFSTELKTTTTITNRKRKRNEQLRNMARLHYAHNYSLNRIAIMYQTSAQNVDNHIKKFKHEFV